MYELRIFQGGKVIETKTFSTHREALQAAMKAERTRPVATDIVYVGK